jgi:hypothetical protein
LTDDRVAVAPSGSARCSLAMEQAPSVAGAARRCYTASTTYTVGRARALAGEPRRPMPRPRRPRRRPRRSRPPCLLHPPHPPPGTMVPGPFGSSVRVEQATRHASAIGHPLGISPPARIICRGRSCARAPPMSMNSPVSRRGPRGW